MHHRQWRTALLLSLVAPASIQAQLTPNHTQQTDSIPNAGWRNVAVGAAVLAATFLVDAPIANVFESPHSASAASAANTFDKFGEMTGIGVVVGGLGIASLVTRDHHVLSATIRTAASVALATGVTQVLKYVVGRERPYVDPDRDALDFHLFKGTPSGTPSFPSGHSSTAFALATSLGDAIDKDWARVALFGLAAGTGWARLQQQQHWVTDVVAGAAVGIVSAKFANGRLRLLGARAPRILLSSRDVGVRWTFPLPAVH
jgi:membrane-associated phospholipid phosphatase